MTRIAVLTLTLTAVSTPVMAMSDVNSGGSAWMISLFEKGGLVMWPILICSIVAVGISMELGWRLRHKNVINSDYLHYLETLAKKKDFSQALKLYTGFESLTISRIIKSGLMRSGYGILEMERAIETAGAHEATKLQANLRGLGVLGNLTPMLGLLGTVIGMIKAFNVISESGTGNPGLVAAGISEALVTTAAGLLVGIPCLAAYHYFKGKADKLVFEMEEVSIWMIDEIQKSKGNIQKPPPEKPDHEVQP